RSNPSLTFGAPGRTTPLSGTPPPTTNPLVRSTCCAWLGSKYRGSNDARLPLRLYHCGHSEYRTPASVVIFRPAFQLSCAYASKAVATHGVDAFAPNSL